jgi:hypothetical protein
VDQAAGGSVNARASIAVLAALIVLGCGRIVSSYSTLNQVYDEPLHVACGLEWLSKGTYTYDYQHPPLATFPLKIRQSVSQRAGACGKCHSRRTDLGWVTNGWRLIQKSVQG